MWQPRCSPWAVRNGGLLAPGKLSGTTTVNAGGVDPDFGGAGVPPGPFHFYTYWPDMPGSCGHRSVQTSPKVPLILGQWTEIVYNLKMNTVINNVGQFNGSQTLWVNGEKKIEQLNMRWRNTTDLRVNMLAFYNWMSAGETDHTQYVWVDDVTVWRP